MMSASRYGKLITIGIFSAVGLIAPAAMAQITPDATLGAESSRLTPNVLIQGGNADRIDGGATRGGNLFHSFSQFNVTDGQRLYFANPTGTQTIFTRVTGNTLSNINGTLGVDGAANLFLLNPNGILFGPNARLDLGSSFVGTTANSIRFGDRGTFSATDPQAVPLLTIQPSALVFTQVNSGKIVSESIAPVGQSPLGRNLLGLRVPDGQNLLLVGGDVEIDGKGIYGGLNAQGGRIELGGLASAGEVGLNNFQLTYPIDGARSNVLLANTARVSTVGIGGGNIVVNANQLMAKTGALVIAGTEGAGDAGDIIVNANVVNVIGTKSFDTSGAFYNQVRSTTATGNAGNITINANEFTIADRALFNTGTNGRGKGGSVNINVRDTVTLDEGYIAAPVTSTANAQGGDVRIKAGAVIIKNGSQIDLSGSGKGNTGDVVIDARDRIDIGSFGPVSSAIFNGIDPGGIGQSGEIRLTTGSLSLLGSAQLVASTEGQGNAGNIIVNARDQILMDRADVSESGAKIGSDVGKGAIGNGGEIRITTSLLSLKNGAQLTSLTSGKGDAGSIVINAKDILFQGRYLQPNGTFNPSGIVAGIDRSGVGNGGEVRVVANSLTIQDKASITNFVRGQGNGGNTFIEARDQVELLSGNVIGSVVQGGIGNAGNIKIRTGAMSLMDKSFIISDTNGVGNAGSISLEANTLTMGRTATGANLLGSYISTDTTNQGNAGNIFISVRDDIFLDNSFIFSIIFEKGKGEGGDIKISAGALRLLNNSSINSSTTGEGNAGNVSIDVRDALFLKNGSNILTSTLSLAGSPGLGNAGNISIQAGDRISLADEAFLSTATYGQGNAGTLRIKAKSLDLSGGSKLRSSTEASGRAGDVEIQATDSISLVGMDATNTQRSGIYSIVDKNGKDQGGNIQISTANLTIADDASISASTLGQGRAGDIRVNADRSVFISGTDRFAESSGLYTISRSDSPAGNIFVTTPSLTLKDRATLRTESTTSNGGNINVNTDVLLLRRNSNISATAGLAQAGGNGGNINLSAKVIVAVAKENSDITANAFSGSGGAVNIQTNGLFGIAARPKLTPLSDITASSEQGVQGTIAITQPDVQPEQGLLELPGDILDASNQIGQSCPNARNNRSMGTFVVSGRGSLPSSPLEPLADNPNLPSLAELKPDDRSIAQAPIPQVTASIVEAQGWRKTSDGKVILIAQPVDINKGANQISKSPFLKGDLGGSSCGTMSN
jgi:filamentous hemagglutinin family protein